MVTLLATELEAKQRVARLLGLMEKDGLDLLVAYSDAHKPDNVFYLTGYNLSAGDAWASLNQNGECNLWVSEEWDLERVVRDSWAVRVEPVRNLLGLGSKLGQGSRKIGLAGKDLVPSHYEKKMGWLLSQASSANSLLERAALVKTREEVELVKRASTIADIGFARALQTARPGIREFELLAEMELAMRLAGATDNFQLMSSGTHNLGMVVGREKQLATGELLLFEITPTISSFTYAAQLCRTIFMGEADKELLAKYEILVKAMDAARSVIRPGIPFKEICRVQDEVVGAAGYSKYCGPPYMRTRGHGFGLAQSFNLDGDNSVLMESGMVVVVHPNQYLPETGYLALGEMVVVTENGCEGLSNTEAKLFCVSEGIQ